MMTNRMSSEEYQMYLENREKRLAREFEEDLEKGREIRRLLNLINKHEPED